MNTNSSNLSKDLINLSLESTALHTTKSIVAGKFVLTKKNKFKIDNEDNDYSIARANSIAQKNLNLPKLKLELKPRKRTECKSVESSLQTKSILNHELNADKNGPRSSRMVLKKRQVHSNRNNDLNLRQSGFQSIPELNDLPPPEKILSLHCRKRIQTYYKVSLTSF